MKNKNIVFCVNLLTPLMFDLEKSSARRRFLRYLSPFKEDFDAELEDIRKEFAEKNADGTQKSVNNKIQFSKGNKKLADSKYEALADLEVPVTFEGEEKDKQVIVDYLKVKVEELKKATEFSDDTYNYLELLEDCLKDLSK